MLQGKSVSRQRILVDDAFPLPGQPPNDVIHVCVVALALICANVRLAHGQCIGTGYTSPTQDPPMHCNDHDNRTYFVLEGIAVENMFTRVKVHPPNS
jgi:hypothetical protein